VKRKFADRIIVITGASTGIGRATALEFARRRAVLVLAARRELVLRELAQQCEALGGRTMIMPLDVANPSAVEELAREANERFGRIDIWVNNAAVSALGRLEQIPIEVHRRVLEVNLLGYINGARAVLPFFREQNSGTLINVSTQAALFGIPFASSYVATKFAIRGLSESLREELHGTNVRVCAVLPGSVDTPLLRQAANYTGRVAQPPRPIISAEKVARAIVDLARRPRREVIVGVQGKVLSPIHSLFPAVSEEILARKIPRKHFGEEREPETPGNLFEPMDFHSVSGGWSDPLKTPSPRKVGLSITGILIFALLGAAIFLRR
jgi:short-subunit dehydrogenase